MPGGGSAKPDGAPGNIAGPLGPIERGGPMSGGSPFGERGIPFGAPANSGRAIDGGRPRCWLKGDGPPLYCTAGGCDEARCSTGGEGRG